MQTVAIILAPRCSQMGRKIFDIYNKSCRSSVTQNISVNEECQTLGFDTYSGIEKHWFYFYFPLLFGINEVPKLKIPSELLLLKIKLGLQ